jgi:hypothetical protein
LFGARIVPNPQRLEGADVLRVETTRAPFCRSADCPQSAARGQPDNRLNKARPVRSGPTRSAPPTANAGQVRVIVLPSTRCALGQRALRWGCVLAAYYAVETTRAPFCLFFCPFSRIPNMTNHVPKHDRWNSILFGEWPASS